MISKKIKSRLIFFLGIFLSQSPTCVNSQCTDIVVLDYSAGKVVTMRMVMPYYLDYSTILLRWENIKKNIDGDFIEFEKKTASYLVTSNNTQTVNVDSCAFNLRNGAYEEKIQSIKDLLFENKDTLIHLIKINQPNEQSSSIKRMFALALMYCKSPQAIGLLIELTKDSCNFVRLQAAFSLSILGEKDVSYKTLLSLWNEQDPLITMDNFPSFTTGFRNIGTKESIEILEGLCKNKNCYCALDASICLYQLGQYQACLKGLKHALTSENKLIFFNAGILLSKYFPTDVIEGTLSEYKNSPNNDISSFTSYLLGILK